MVPGAAIDKAVFTGEVAQGSPHLKPEVVKGMEKYGGMARFHNVLITFKSVGMVYYVRMRPCLFLKGPIS